jgi:hypothetical protein
MEPMIKGYAVQYTSQFILEDPELSALVPPSVLDVARRAEDYKPTAWAPRMMAADMWRAIAAARPDPAVARATLVRCGKGLGNAAINSFLKILLRMLTPRLFALKFPDMWGRDMQESGYAEIAASEDKRIVILLREVGGFDHLGPVAEGWIGFTLASMGLKHLEMTSSPWSMEEPGPPEVRLEARWQ